MSNQSNTNLMERASEMIAYWEGTQIASRLEEDIKTNDLEELQADLTAAEWQASVEEIHGANL